MYDAVRLDVRYPFELSADTVNGSFEAFLPQEEQIARFLPRLLHPDAREPLNQVILRFAGGREEEIAAAMRPAVEQWRARAECDPCA